MNRTRRVEIFLVPLIAGAFLHYAEAACSPSEFLCPNGKCIERRFFCNYNDDCGDYSDEQFCNIDSSVSCPLGWIRCPNMLRCIPPHWMCDGMTDCLITSEERSCDSLICTPSLFQCRSGYCIPRPWFCDGKVDCEDDSDESYCDISPESMCPHGWTHCPDMKRCILSHWKCDGVIDCPGISEENNCGNNTSKTLDTTAARTPYNSAVLKQDTTATKAELKSWILRGRKPGSGTDQWGPQVHRIAVVLHLADSSTFNHGKKTGEEIRYEMTIQLLSRLAKDKKMRSQELALYIHALLVACMDPRDFYGDNLVQELRRRVEAAGNYTNPFLILALCNAGDTMTARDVERVISAYSSQRRPFWIESQALASMALSCISSNSDVSVDEQILKDMLLGLKTRQSKNWTVENFKATALVTQALFIHDSYRENFTLVSAMKVLVDGLKESRSLLNAYYALPALHHKSLLNVTTSHCRKQPVAEEEALQNVLDIEGETMTVQFSIWMGDDINLVRTWRLKMPENSTIYDAIETVAKIDNRQKVEYNILDGKPYVSALNKKEEDPEMGLFWFVYLKTLGSDEDPKIVDKSPADVKLKSEQEIILWYKPDLWSDLSGIQKPVTTF